MSNSGGKATKAGIAYTVGNILLRGITFLTLPIFTRILTPEECGLYNLYVSYEVLLTIFVGLCLYGSLRTAKYDYKKNFSQYITSTLSLSIVSFVIILLLGNIVYPFFSAGFMFDRTILNVLIIHSYAMFVFQFYNTQLALDYTYKQFLIVSGANSIGGTALSLFLILYVFKHNKHIARIYGYAFVPIFIALLIWYKYFRVAVKQKNRLFIIEHWKYGLTISLPLVIHTFSQQILHQFDRIMISRLVDNAAVGIYSFIYTIANILQIIVQSMDNAWSVWMYEQLNQKKYSQIKEKSAAYILLMNVLYIGFISLAPDVIHVAGTKAYYVGTKMVIPLAFSVYFVFLYSLTVHIEYYYKKTKYIAIGTSIAALFNIILNYFCINKFGYQASAWTTLVSYFALFLFHWFIAKNIDNRPMFPVKMILGSVFGLIIYSIIIIWFIDYMLIRWGAMIISLIGMFAIHHDILRTTMEMIPFIKKLKGD